MFVLNGQEDINLTPLGSRIQMYGLPTRVNLISKWLCFDVFASQIYSMPNLRLQRPLGLVWVWMCSAFKVLLLLLESNANPTDWNCLWLTLSLISWRIFSRSSSIFLCFSFRRSSASRIASRRSLSSSSAFSLLSSPPSSSPPPTAPVCTFEKERQRGKFRH